jgi:hypothetical protein
MGMDMISHSVFQNIRYPNGHIKTPISHGCEMLELQGLFTLFSINIIRLVKPFGSLCYHYPM